MRKIYHPKDKSVYVTIPEIKPIKPSTRPITFEKTIFHSAFSAVRENISIRESIVILRDAEKEGFQTIAFDYYNETIKVQKTESTEEYYDRIDKEQREYEMKLQTYQKENEKAYAEALVELEKKFNEKLNFEKRKREKYNDPSFIEFLRMQAAMKEKGFI